MSNIVGRLIFDIRRNGIIDGNDYGIGNVPIVLQNISTNERLAVYTTLDGTYEFTDVPLGDYRIILVDGYEGTILTSPANFEENTQVGETPTAKLPPYTILKGPYPIETNTLNAVTPTTVFITVSDNTQNTAQTIFVGPARYEPLVSNTLDKCASVGNINLLQAVDNGTFGEVAPGTQPDGGPIVNPYPDIAPGFTFRPQYREINDGYYTIGNTIDPYPLFEWWRLSDHTTSIETGLMEIVNGANPGAIFFTTDVNISENTDYLFSAWVININNAVLDPPALSVEILNEIGEIIFFENIGAKLDASTVLPIWKEIGSVFNSGNNTKLKINFYSEGAATTGNDYAVDDISLRTITQPTFVPIKEVSNEYAKIGDIVTYTISVTNTCNNLLTDVIITDTVPTGLEFVQGSVIYNGVSNPDANPNDGIQIGTIGSGKTATITYEARVSQITSDPIINNTANLQYGYTPILGEVPRVFNEESNRVPLYVGQAIIGGSTPNSSFTKSADKEVVNVGDIITYTIIAKNIGNVQARNVVITDLLSSDVSYIEGSLNSTVEITGNPLSSISLTNPLGVDEQARITFDVIVNQLPSDNQITNSASVTFNYTENPEKPYAAIGRGVTNTVNTIVANTTLSIIKSQDINTVIVGDVVTYTLDVTNTGNLTYTNVIVSDPVQPKLTFIPGSVTINGEVSSGNIEEGVNIGDLSPNKKVIIRFRARVNDNQSSRFIDNVGETQYNVVIGDISEELNKSSNKVTLEVLNASLKVNKISNTDILMVGEVFEYIVNVENTGDVELKDVNLFDNFPSQFKVLNVFVDNTVMQNTKVNNFNIGNLEPGQIKNIRIILKVVNDGLINFKNTITAIGKAQIGTTKPAITVKDAATDVNSVSIIQRSNVEVIKRANKRCICVGDVITYTITVNNNSNISIGTSNEPVILYDYLSLNSKFIYGSLKINNVKVNNVDINNGINLGILRPNEKKTVQFSVEVYDCYDYYYVINSAKIVYGYRVINGATITNSESSNVLRIPIV